MQNSTDSKPLPRGLTPGALAAWAAALIGLACVLLTPVFPWLEIGRAHV